MTIQILGTSAIIGIWGKESNSQDVCLKNMVEFTEFEETKSSPFWGL